MNSKRIFGTILILILLALGVWIAIQGPETIFPALNALLMIGFGLGIGILVSKKWGVGWGLFGVGALTFILSQVLHIPFNTYLLNPFLRKIFPQADPGSSGLLWWSVFLGLSAGAFEETARYLVLRFWRKDVTTWEQSMMFGAGHGGVEAIIVGAITFVAFLQLTAYRQMDLNTLADQFSPEQFEALRTTVDTFWNLKWYEHLWGAAERFSVIPVHLAATVLVYRGVRNRNILWYLAAVAWHAAVDCLAVFSSQTWGIPLTELFIFIFGLLGWGIVIWVKKQEPSRQPEDPGQEPFSPPVLPALETAVEEKQITQESLDESKYD